MKAETNHIYIGREDRLTQWAGIAEENDGGNELAEEHRYKLVAKIIGQVTGHCPALFVNLQSIIIKPCHDKDAYSQAQESIMS